MLMNDSVLTDFVAQEVQPVVIKDLDNMVVAQALLLFVVKKEVVAQVETLVMLLLINVCHQQKS